MLLIGAGVFLALDAVDGGHRDARDLPKSAMEKRAERIEERLGEDPTDERALLATMKAWLNAGSDRLFKLDTQNEPIPSLVSEDYRAGLRAWNRYLKQTAGKADAEIAEQVAATYFNLVEIGSRDLGAVEANPAGAVRAERIAAEQQPGVITHSNLAIYQYFNGEFAAGDRTARALAVDISHELHTDPHERLLLGYRERAEKFVRRVKRAAEMLRESGEERLSIPIKGYGFAGGLNGGEEQSGGTSGP